MEAKSYSRLIRFSRIGLHNDPDPLTVEVGVTDDGHGPYRSGPSLGIQIEQYARGFLDHDGTLKVHVHPDQHDGRITQHESDGTDGGTLATFTVHLVDEQAPAADVDLSDITTVVETAVLNSQRVHGVTRCRSGAIVRVHSDYTHRVRDVLAATGYTVRVVEGVLLVRLDQS